MSLVLYILRMGRCSRFVCKNRSNRRKVQRCVIWKVSNLDEIRYDNKLNEEKHKENIDNNDDKQVIEPLPGSLPITSLWWV